MEDPEIKLNPHPRVRYEITLSVEGAPGPFDRIEGQVDYRVQNESCVPPIPISGARPIPTYSSVISFLPTGPHTYKATLFADLMKDEDYFGKGVCSWAVVAASVSLWIGKGAFDASLFRDKMVNGTEVTTYFPVSAYSSDVAFSGTGAPDSRGFTEKTKAFSISIRAAEVAP